MGDEATTRPKKRRTRAELRELMLNAGVEVLDAQGVEVQISSVSYARVFEHLERTSGIRVTYGSVHERIWDSLQAYQLDVIERAGMWDAAAGGSRIGGILTELLAGVDLDDEAARHAAAVRSWRRIGEIRAAADTHDAWTSWLATIVAMRTQPDESVVSDAARLGAETNYRQLEQAFAATVGAALARLGYRPDPVFAAESDPLAVLARMSIAVADGLDLRRTLTGETGPAITLTTGPDGEAEAWDAYAATMWGLTRAFFHLESEEPGS